jgi:outer membrane lipoprotein-sorting protein
MRKLTIALILMLSTAVAAFAQGADAKAKADAVLKQAREAIGGEKKLKELQALSATGTMRQTMGERQMESEIQVDLMTPDKIMTTIAMQFGGNPIGTRISTLNGDQLWGDFVSAMGMGGGPGGGVFIAGGGPGGGGGRMMMGGGPGGPGGPGDPNSPMAKYQQMSQRRDLALIMLGWLLAAPPGAQMEFTYAGEAPGPEGSKLDALIARSALGFNAVLYFNQDSHQLIGIKYKAKQTRAMFGGRGPGGPGGGQAGQAGQAGQGGQRQGGGQPGQPGQPRPEITPEERERRMKEAMERFEKAPEVDISWAFADYKSVGGLNLPHRLTKSEGGTPNEEWEISKFKVNPKLTAEKFVKKEKDKASTN